MKTLSVGAEMFYSDGQINTTKLIDASRNYAKGLR